MLEHVGRHGAGSQPNLRDSGATPLRRSRERDAAEHAAARSGAGDLPRPRPGNVDRVETHTERVGARDVALLLDGVAIGDAVRGWRRPRAPSRSTGIEAVSKHEARSKRKQRRHFGRRIGLHGVEHARVGQRLGEVQIVLADHVEIDDEARPVVLMGRLAGTQKITDARSHMAPSSPGFNEPSRLALKFERTNSPGVSG